MTDDLEYYAQAKQQEFEAIEFLSEYEYEEGTYYTDAREDADESIKAVGSYVNDLSFTSGVVVET